MASIESDLADLRARPAWDESGAAEVEESSIGMTEFEPATSTSEFFGLCLNP
jgi:hypothetical protein